MVEGNGASRRLVMYKDFVIIGPEADPAKIKGLKAAAALRRIAEAKAPFVSRGDQSGKPIASSRWQKPALCRLILIAHQERPYGTYAVG